MTADTPTEKIKFHSEKENKTKRRLRFLGYIYNKFNLLKKNRERKKKNKNKNEWG